MATGIVFNQDCIAGMAERIGSSTVDLTVTSIPFEELCKWPVEQYLNGPHKELFTYSGKAEDVGNNGSTIDVRAGRFALNMRFVANQLYRVHKPGTNCCIHLQTLLAYANQHGFQGRRDFRGAMVDVFCAEGFIWAGEAAQTIAPPLSAAMLRELADEFPDDDASLSYAVARLMGIPLPREFTIVKDPQRAANMLNLHSLQFKTGYARTATMLAPWINDYVMIFHKPGEIEVPVRPLKHPKNPNGWLSTEEWIRDAHGCWTDILEIDTLTSCRSRKVKDALKEATEEKHVCPFAMETVRRLVKLYSNPELIQPGVTVLDPFMGIGSTGVIAVELGRNAIGFELKESYFQMATKNISAAMEGAQSSNCVLQRDLYNENSEDTCATSEGAA